MSRAQLCLYIEGSGINTEYCEEEGGKHCGAANCSKSTVHSIGRNAGGFFLQATSAHVGLVAMVQLTMKVSLLLRSIEYVDIAVCLLEWRSTDWYSGIGGREMVFSSHWALD